MKTIMILHYRAEWGDGKIVDNAIDIHTQIVNVPFMSTHKIPMTMYRQLACSHSETLLVEDGECYTSTMGQTGGPNRPKINGMICQNFHDTLKYPTRWFGFVYRVNDGTYDEVRHFLQSKVAHNKGYDKKLILKYFIGAWAFAKLKLGEASKYICSEITAWALRVLTRLETSPTNDYQRLITLLQKDSSPSPLRLALYQYLDNKMPIAGRAIYGLCEYYETERKKDVITDTTN